MYSKNNSENNSGPKYVKEQFEEVWTELTEDEKEQICKNIKNILKQVQKIIADSVATIPNFGPALAFIFETSDIVSFDNFSDLYENIPLDIKKIINNPALIRNNINEFITYFNKELNSVGIELPKIKKPKKQKGSGIIDTAVSGVSGAVSGIAKGAVSSYVGQIEKNINMGKKQAEKIVKANIGTIKPLLKITNVLGINNLTINPTIKYINTVLTPAVNISIKLLSIIFPLFFSLLLAKKEC